MRPQKKRLAPSAGQFRFKVGAVMCWMTPSASVRWHDRRPSKRDLDATLVVIPELRSPTAKGSQAGIITLRMALRLKVIDPKAPAKFVDDPAGAKL